MPENKEYIVLYACMKGFRHLRKGDVVFIGDQPDARICTSLEKVKITKNWPSQWHSRHPKGYIGFEEGRRFDLAREQIAGRPAYLFPGNPAIVVICRRLKGENRLLQRLGLRPFEKVL